MRRGEADKQVGRRAHRKEGTTGMQVCREVGRKEGRQVNK